MTTNTGQLPVGGERGSSDLSSNVTREDPDQEICQISESEIDDDAKEVDYDSDQVLSEVHIHPDNGKVDGRFITSYFTLFPPNFDNIVLAPEQTSAGSHDEESDDDSQPGIVLEIRHAMGSTLRDVGLQVWMGSFLLIDYLLEHRALFNGAVALELGAGTGLASIAVDVAGSFEKIICTDYDENLLRNCVINIEQNMPESSTSHVLVRRLNWLADNFFSSSASARVEEPDSNDLFAWSDEDVELWRTKGSLIFGADGNLVNEKRLQKL
ncbi:Methyltransferase-like protein 22 [Actinomortierella wolfii]|nr:Methyltransferase-like protein 22 [Actinomortierella wolfii]